MDSFEKKQIVLQLFEYMDDYYLMHPDKKGELPDWSKIDYYNESYPTACHNLITSILCVFGYSNDTRLQQVIVTVLLMLLLNFTKTILWTKED